MDPRQGRQVNSPLDPEEQLRHDLQIYGNAFVGVDYASLEPRVLRNLLKTVNFGHHYGMGPQKLSSNLVKQYAESDIAFNFPTTRVCPKCGCDMPIYEKEHGRRLCMYGRALKDQEQRGYVPAVGMFHRLLSVAGVPVVRAPFHTRPEFRNKHDQYPPLQEGDYVSVWALLVIRQGHLGSLTSPKRPKVKKVIEQLRKTMTDVEEQRVILGEHILQQGPYTAACRALIGRLME
jgi:hypothetical protein